MTTVKLDSSERLYRPDIDGLRSIAILSVVLFHAGVPLCNGGFTGVDIFFVLSGYLIGGHIFSEINSSAFSYLRFYQRRAKRILPAFYVVLAFILLAALVLMSPFEANQVGYSAFAATLSGANVLFWKTNSYFETSNRLNPLLMTWSLGVEEQFYAVIPVLMIALARIRKNWMFPAVLGACLVSLLFSQLELASHSTLVFYMLPARAWELGAGVALAVFELSQRRKTLTVRATQIVSLCGLALMLVPVFLLNEQTPFPGVAALPSVLGTTLLLATPASWINRRLLSLPPFVFIGRISYSWYLWHWPMLSLMRLLHGGSRDDLSTRDALLTIAAAFCASVLSYYFVEQPLRRSRRLPVPLLIRYAIASAAVLMACAGLWLSHGAAARFPLLSRMEASRTILTNNPCLANQDKLNLSPACYPPLAGQPAIALWGDSHAAALAPGLRSIASNQGYGFIQLGHNSCPPVLGVTHYRPWAPKDGARCLGYNRKALEVLEADHNVKIVFLASYWAAPFLRTWKDGWLTGDLSQASRVPSLDEERELLISSLSASIRSLQAAGKQVVVVADSSAFDFDPVLRVRTAQIPARRALAAWLAEEEAGDTGTASPQDAPAYSESASGVRQTVAGLPNVTLFDLNATLCRGPGVCTYRDGDRLLYIDRDHLSPEGSSYAFRGFSLPTSAAKGD